jgi:hypothetical protein
MMSRIEPSLVRLDLVHLKTGAQAMELVQGYLNELLAFLREGFNHVNVVQGLVIALVASFLMPQWKRLWTMALGATVIHVIANVMIPVVANHAAFKLPQIVTLPFWRYALTLYVGYVIVIAVFFFVKSSVLGGGGHKKAAASH